MGVFITPKEEIQNYFDSTALNQSTLKELEYGLDHYLATVEKRAKETVIKEHFLIGSAVDTILTGEDGQFEQEFHISKLETKPSDIEMKMIDFVFENIFDNVGNVDEITSLEDYKGFIKAAYDFYNWQPKWKEETKIDKFLIFGADYFEDLKKAQGKKVLSETQKNLIDTIVLSLRNNPRTKKYFDRENLRDNLSVDIFYQVPIYFKYKDVDCKALLDLVVFVKNATGSIIKVLPIDLKTMSGYTIDFPKSMRTRRYDIQGSWYCLALTSDTAIFPENFPIIENMEDLLEQFMFIVESTTSPGKPLNFVMSNSLYSQGIDGFYNENGLVRKGINSLIEDYKYHLSTGFKEDRVVTENNGVLSLSWNGIEYEYEY